MKLFDKEENGMKLLRVILKSILSIFILLILASVGTMMWFF